ncbi:MAG: PucR family transcriptional regulator [Miltoncostaeaceae bacterium]
MSTRTKSRQRATSAPAGRPLAEILALPALEGAQLLPADAGDQVRVCAVVLDDPGARSEDAALLVSVTGIPKTLPTGVVAVITRASVSGKPAVPVITIPDDRPWGDVIGAIHAHVSGRAREMEARDALRRVLIAGHGAPGIAEAAGEVLGTPVAILDEYLDVLSTSGLTDARDDSLRGAIEAARSHGPASLLGPFTEAGIKGAHILRLTSPGSDDLAGVLVSWGPKPAPGDPALIALADALLVERRREDTRVDTEARLRGELIEELLAGEVVSRESLVRRARHLGADLSMGAVALVGTLQDPHESGRVISDPRLIRRFMQQTRGVLELHWPRALVDWHEGLLVILLPKRAEGEEGESAEELAHTLARRLLAATGPTVPGLTLTLALSRQQDDPEKLGSAIDEAQLALSIGEKLGRSGEVVTFEETGTYKLLFQVFADRPEEIEAFFEQTMAPLVRYDEQYQTELVGTVATYLDLDCNLAATAQTLYTHRHTIRYRLDRITELAGLDIGKTDDREKLSLGLKAMRLLGRTVAAPMREKPQHGTKAARGTKG